MQRNGQDDIEAAGECLSLFRDQAKLTKGATLQDIEKAENELNVAFPVELRELLKKTNGVKDHGGRSLIWSTSELVAKNQFYRTDSQIAQVYMPLQHLILFSDGLDDCLFGYPIGLSANNEGAWIFFWNRKTDARDYAKFNLAELAQELVAPGKILLNRISGDGWNECEPSLEPLKPQISKHWRTFTPATEEEIRIVEAQLGTSIPESLKEFYRFSNGVNSEIGFEIFSVQELVAQNASIRRRYHELEGVMAADSFLFIASAGTGDFLGFPVTGAGIGDTIFILYRETDGRDCIAEDLYNLLDSQLEEFKEDDEDDPLYDLTCGQLETLGLERLAEGSLKGFYSAFPHLKNTGLELYNALPQTLLEQHPGLFKAGEVHSLKYLSGIPETAQHNKKYVIHLLTESWKAFLRFHRKPSRTDVLGYMRDLDDLYGQYFVPELSKGAR